MLGFAVFILLSFVIVYSLIFVISNDGILKQKRLEQIIVIHLFLNKTGPLFFFSLSLCFKIKFNVLVFYITPFRLLFYAVSWVSSCVFCVPCFANIFFGSERFFWPSVYFFSLVLQSHFLCRFVVLLFYPQVFVLLKIHF